MIQHDTWILVFLGITLLLALISGLLCLRFSSLQQHYRHLHQRLQEQETTGAQHQSMLSHLPVFLILHTRTEICYCNPAALLALGQMDASQVIGKPLASFVMPSEMASVTAFIESAFQQTAEMPALKKAVRFSTWPDRSCLLTLMAQPFVYNHQPAVMITSTTAVPAADSRASP
jgi:PAS domain-containing protein